MEWSSDFSKLTFCSALQPAYRVQVLVNSQSANFEGTAGKERLVTRRDDWPDTYRLTPLKPEDAEPCIVQYRHTDRNAQAYLLYSGMLFGLPLTLKAFRRFSKLAEAPLGRHLGVSYSMYFDDGCIQDWRSAKGSAQGATSEFMNISGSPFADAKDNCRSVRRTVRGLSTK